MLENARYLILVGLITSAVVPDAAPGADITPPPFTLTLPEQAERDRVLKLWEEESAKIETLRCRFKRWEYDSVFGPANAARYEDLGEIAYAAPDRGMFQVDRTVIDGQESEIEPDRAEHWIYDGKSLYEYREQQKQLVRFGLLPDLQGGVIGDWCLPFTLFIGGQVEDLKRRYYIRVNTPQNLPAPPQQTWLEFYPKNASWWWPVSRVMLILTGGEMRPFAMQILASNGKQQTVLQFFELSVNGPLDRLGKNPLDPVLPFGWQRVSIGAAQREKEESPPASLRPASTDASKSPAHRRCICNRIRLKPRLAIAR